MTARSNPLRPSFLREPLIHFVLLGALVFVAHRFIGSTDKARTVVVSAELKNLLRSEHLRHSGKEPSADELQALIDRWIDNEVLYREAVALGLDRDDVIVRRRLIQKMAFLTEDIDPIPEPSDADLSAFLTAHADRYHEPARMSFTHVYLSDPTRNAAEIHTALIGGADPAGIGEPFARGREFRSKSETEVASIFGAAFAAALHTAETDTWVGPVRSSFGNHFVRIVERTAAAEPTLEALGERLRNDWQEEKREGLNRIAAARLRGRYRIQVEGNESP